MATRFLVLEKCGVGLDCSQQWRFPFSLVKRPPPSLATKKKKHTHAGMGLTEVSKKECLLMVNSWVIYINYLMISGRSNTYRTGKPYLSGISCAEDGGWHGAQCSHPHSWKWTPTSWGTHCEANGWLMPLGPCATWPILHMGKNSQKTLFFSPRAKSVIVKPAGIALETITCLPHLM